MRRFSTVRGAASDPVPGRTEFPDARWHGLLKAAIDLVHAAGDVDDALAGALDLIREYSGWPLGHAVLLDDTTARLTSTRVWRADDLERFADFIAASESMQLAAGEGLPGRVAASGEPAWIEDVTADDNFPRAGGAGATGIRSAAAVPIPSRRGVIGVLEFFADNPTGPDGQLLDLLAHVGAQVGVVVDRNRETTDRLRAEAALRRSEQHLAEAQRLAHMGSWSWDVGADHVIWSAELHRLYGLSDEAGPVSFDEYVSRVHPEDRQQVTEAVRRAVETLEAYEHDYRIVWPDGTLRWVHAAGAVAARAGDTATRLAGFCHDVTEQHEAEERRRTAQEALASHRSLLERVARGEPLAATLEALCREVEARFPGTYCSVLMVTAGESVLRHAAAPSLPEQFRTSIDGLAIHERAGACGRAAATLEDVVVADTLTDELTSEFVTLAQEHSLRSVWSHPLTTASGELLGTFAVYRSVPHSPDAAEVQAIHAASSIAAVAIERMLTEKALTAAARLDPLTGLANRTAFLHELAHRLAQHGSVTAVLFLDLDRFKWINDSLGHPVGDKILVEVAWRLESALDGQHLLARFGGDEFTVLVDHATPAVLEELAARLEAALDAPFHLEGGEFFLSVSIGIATDAYGGDPFDLVRDADAAMYAAKEGGRARHAIFDSALRERALDRVTTESELRRAIERDEFVMYYQPIVSLQSGLATGAEALVRWQHPTRNLVLPDRFIPLAEETGLIIALGQRVLERVLSDGAPLCRDRAAHLAINVSVVQLSDPAFPAALAEALVGYGVPADQLVVEVTETALMQEVETARAALERLVQLGVRVFIDDFGTGYSSIARLRELPVAGVKIDRSFSVDLGQDPRADDLLAAITDLAHAIGLEVVVEGIETAAAYAKAVELGCDYAQGFHIARPAPKDVLASLRA